jgi:hypothetical protein
LNPRALAILPLLAACAEESVDSDHFGYFIWARADLVETSTVPWRAVLYSVLAEEGVGFESMAWAESTADEPTSHWRFHGNLAAVCSGSRECPPLPIREGFLRLSSPMRLELYAVLGLDESAWSALAVDKPPARPGDLYAYQVPSTFEPTR